MKSSLPTIGSAKRWEVVGNIRIIDVISFGYIVVILFCLAVFSRLGRQCKPPRLDLSETLHQLEFWHGLHESFLRKPSSDISTSPPSSGDSSDFQFYGPSLILYSSATWETTTRPCVSPHHMSLQSKLAQWLTYWATSVPVVLKEACSSCSPRVAVQHCLSSVMRLV